MNCSCCDSDSVYILLQFTVITLFNTYVYTVDVIWGWGEISWSPYCHRNSTRMVTCVGYIYKSSLLYFFVCLVCTTKRINKITIRYTVRLTCMVHNSQVTKTIYIFSLLIDLLYRPWNPFKLTGWLLKRSTERTLSRYLYVSVPTFDWSTSPGETHLPQRNTGRY